MQRRPTISQRFVIFHPVVDNRLRYDSLLAFIPTSGFFIRMLVMHEMVELIKALAWPGVAMYFVVKFRSEIGALLDEMPSVIRRMRSAHGLGVEIELEKI